MNEITGTIAAWKTDTEALAQIELDGGTFEAKDIIKARGFRFVPSPAPYSDDPAKWVKTYRVPVADADLNNIAVREDWEAIAAVKPLKLNRI